MSASWFSFTLYTSTLSRCTQNFKTLALTGAEKGVTKNLLERKKTWTINMRLLVLSYNKSYPMFLPNFKILGAVVLEKSLTQISLCIALEWEMEKRTKKESKINFSNVVFFYTIFFNPLYVYTKFENAGSHRSWEICDEKFNWRERKNGQIKVMIGMRILILSYTI